MKAAREWVAQILTEIGRSDLVDNAQVGVTELVTNAILHSQPPLSVRIRGTFDHPRIEVQDYSPVPPQPSRGRLLGDDPSTVGRGLSMVAMMSAKWGTDLDIDGRSKTVWFEPAGDHHDTEEGEYALFSEVHRTPDDEVDRSEFVAIELHHFPALLFAELRRHHFEIRRELRLLALSAPDRYPLAVRFTEIYEQADSERRMVRGIDRLDAAITEGTPVVDLKYDVPPTAPGTMEEVLGLFAEVYSAFADDHLLAIAPPQPMIELQRWYFGEFVRQGAGLAPIPWPGPTTLDG